jgi:O-antigen/teichoic acid export membrane protein
MKPQDPRQRIQRNRAIAVQVAMIVAGVGTFFVMQALNGSPEHRDFSVFAACGSYGISVFYVWLQIRRWRREKRMKQILAERGKRKQDSPTRP